MNKLLLESPMPQIVRVLMIAGNMEWQCLAMVSQQISNCYRSKGKFSYRLKLGDGKPYYEEKKIVQPGIIAKFPQELIPLNRVQAEIKSWVE